MQAGPRGTDFEELLKRAGQPWAARTGAKKLGEMVPKLGIPRFLMEIGYD